MPVAVEICYVTLATKERPLKLYKDCNVWTEELFSFIMPLLLPELSGYMLERLPQPINTLTTSKYLRLWGWHLWKVYLSVFYQIPLLWMDWWRGGDLSFPPGLLWYCICYIPQALVISETVWGMPMLGKISSTRLVKSSLPRWEESWSAFKIVRCNALGNIIVCSSVHHSLGPFWCPLVLAYFIFSFIWWGGKSRLVHEGVRWPKLKGF